MSPVTSTDITSAVAVVNGTRAVAGQTYPQALVFAVEELLINRQQLPITAGSDVIIQQFAKFSGIGGPTRLNSTMHIYDQDMQMVACFRDAVTVTYQQDKDTAALVDNTVAAPSASSYQAKLIKWANCRANDPVQVTDYHVYITQDVALTEVITLSTSIDISIGTIFVNASNTFAGTGQVLPDSVVFSLDQWTVQNVALPWTAGSTALPLVLTTALTGYSSLSRVAVDHIYDANMNEIGCLMYTGTVTAPASQLSALTHQEAHRDEGCPYGREA